MDWSDWSFWQWLGAALALVVTIIGIKLAVTFDINKYREERREFKKNRLKALCPHTEVRVHKSGEIFAVSRFYKPSMTYNYICSQCGLVVPGKESTTEIAQGWLSDPDEWEKANKRFRTAYNKFYGV